MSAETLERSVLEGKDREQLIAIATALGLKALSRAKKGEIIDRILEQTGAAPAAGTLGSTNGNGSGGDNAVASAETGLPAAAADASQGDQPASAGRPGLLDGEPPADWELALGDDDPPVDTTAATPDATAMGVERQPAPASSSTPLTAPVVAPAGGHEHQDRSTELHDDRNGDGSEGSDGSDGADGQGGSRRRRRRRRKGGGLDDGPQGADRQDNREPREPREQREPRPSGPLEELGAGEPVQVSGYLDLRDEGSGFLRVNG
jgi:transcription termination factor Rho